MASMEDIGTRLVQGRKIVDKARPVRLELALKEMVTAGLRHIIATAQERHQTVLDRVIDTDNHAQLITGPTDETNANFGAQQIADALKGSADEDMASSLAESLDRSLDITSTQVHRARTIAEQMSGHLAALSTLAEEFEGIINPDLTQVAEVGSQAAAMLSVTADEYMANHGIVAQ